MSIRSSIKRWGKFILTSTLVLFVLFLLVLLPTYIGADCIDRWFEMSSFNVFILSLYYFGISILALLALLVIEGLFVTFFEEKKRLKIVVFTLCLSFFYGEGLLMSYDKVVDNFDKTDKELRSSLCGKIERTNEMEISHKAEGLSYEEFLVVSKYIILPEIDSSAVNISYSFGKEMLLDDYVITLDYLTLLSIEQIDTFYTSNNGLIESLSAKVKGDSLTNVHYSRVKI